MSDFALPRAVFLSSNDHSPMFGVFSPSCRARLRRLLALPERVFVPSDEIPADTEYVFSTWGMPALTEAEIAARLPRLKAVFYAAGSVQAFARPFLARGIAVHSAYGANAVPVAEVTCAEIILANKGFYQTSRVFRESGKPASTALLSHYPGNYNTRVGLLGAGMIGSLVAEKLRDYALETLVFDPFVSDGRLAALGARRASLEEIFETCGVVSNHLANNERTRGMLGYALFSRMQPYATFLNTGRGAQVCEDDLVRALREVPTRTAVLDVTFPEPPEAGHPFYTLPNVVLTPHLAGSMQNEVARMGEYMADECERVLSGAPARWQVTAAMLETMA